MGVAGVVCGLCVCLCVCMFGCPCVCLCVRALVNARAVVAYSVSPLSRAQLFATHPAWLAQCRQCGQNTWLGTPPKHDLCKWCRHEESEPLARLGGGQTQWQQAITKVERIATQYNKV